MKCDHNYPFVVRVADTIVKPCLKDERFMVIDRHCDCIFCGPSTVRIKVIRDRDYKKNQVLLASNGE